MSPMGGRGAAASWGSPKSLGVAKRDPVELGTGRDWPWWPRVPLSPTRTGLVHPSQYQENGKIQVANPQNTISMNGIILESVFRPSRAPQYECARAEFLTLITSPSSAVQPEVLLGKGFQLRVLHQGDRSSG